MNDPNLNLLEAAVRLLEPLLDELVFVGGCMTGLLISDFLDALLGFLLPDSASQARQALPRDRLNALAKCTLAN